MTLFLLIWICFYLSESMYSSPCTFYMKQISENIRPTETSPPYARVAAMTSMQTNNFETPFIQFINTFDTLLKHWWNTLEALVKHSQNISETLANVCEHFIYFLHCFRTEFVNLSCTPSGTIASSKSSSDPVAIAFMKSGRRSSAWFVTPVSIFL